MTVTDTLERGQRDVGELRAQVATVREVLERADDVLSRTEDALAGADRAVRQTRRLAPYLVAGVAIVAVAGVALVIVRRRRAASRPSA